MAPSNEDAIAKQLKPQSMNQRESFKLVPPNGFQPLTPTFKVVL